MIPTSQESRALLLDSEPIDQTLLQVVRNEIYTAIGENKEYVVIGNKKFTESESFLFGHTNMKMRLVEYIHNLGYYCDSGYPEGLLIIWGRKEDHA